MREFYLKRSDDPVVGQVFVTVCKGLSRYGCAIFYKSELNLVFIHYIFSGSASAIFSLMVAQPSGDNMSKINPDNTPGRKVLPGTDAHPKSSSSSTTDSQSEDEKPKLKPKTSKFDGMTFKEKVSAVFKRSAEKKGESSGNGMPGRSALVEEDGNALRNYSESEDGSSDDDELNRQFWDRKFDAEMQERDAKVARQREKKASNNVLVDTDMPKSADANKAGSKKDSVEKKPTKKNSGGGSNSTTDEPLLVGRERSSTVREKMRDGLQRLARASMTSADFEVESFDWLVSGRWIPDKSVKRDVDGSPMLDTIPSEIRKGLTAEHASFFLDGEPREKSVDRMEKELKDTIAKRFLSMVLGGEGSDFDQSRIGSMAAINQYLSKKFGFKIEPPGSAVSTDPATPSSEQSENDFIELLFKDTVSRSCHYRVIWSVDLGEEIKSDPYTLERYAETIGAAMIEEKVTKTPGQRTDVSATLVRDFSNSVYEIESADGSVKVLNSIDEFVAFIGDPQKTGLPLQVSQFTTQNMGVFIKNLMFSKTDDNGRPQTVLKLVDGTPVTISGSPKARYRLKKSADDSIEIKYHSRVETKDAAGGSKTTASIWVNNGAGSDWKRVVIKNAIADVDCRILVHPDGTATMGKLEFKAEGWNTVD